MRLPPSDILTVRLPLPLREAEPLVRSALRSEQFGVITEVDYQQRFREKLGVDHPPHRTLGACNPRLALDALSLDPDVALTLPCNVVLREEAGVTIVTALRPTVALSPYGELVHPIAEKAEAAIGRAFAHLTMPLAA